MYEIVRISAGIMRLEWWFNGASMGLSFFLNGM